jgi:glycosyltransferase involved in cell wall biosynthesis
MSQTTVDDLVRLGVARREKFCVIPIGLDLELAAGGDRASGTAFRAEIEASEDDTVVTYVGRLAPIKRVDDSIAAVARVRRASASVRLVVVGDGELRASLERPPVELGVGE